MAAKEYFCPRCGDEVEIKDAICRRCKSDPYPIDTHIRTHAKLKIFARPKHGSAIWTDQHYEERYTQQEALIMADDEAERQHD